jgi:hypothetical protein
MRNAIYLFLVIIIISCQVKEEMYTLENPGIKTALDKRKEAYAEVFMKNCTREINEQADRYVDSIVSAEIYFRVSDEVVFPAKPVRPEFENPDDFQDTLYARPLFTEKKPF